MPKTIRPRLPAREIAISAGILGVGGVETHLQLLCRLLRRAGLHTRVYATGAQCSAATLSELAEPNCRLIRPPRALCHSPKLGAIYSLLAWPLSAPVRAVSLYCLGAGGSHLYLRRLIGRKSVSIYHEVVSIPSKDSEAGKCVSGLQVAVANSQLVADKMLAWWPGKIIRVIPFLTSEQRLPMPPMRLAIGGRELRVVYLGRLAKQKRPDVLVKEWSRLSAVAPLKPARLDVYGSDPSGKMLEELGRFIRETGIPGAVTMHGSYELSELNRILANADVVVLPSLWEGLPLVLVEAMLRGIPIVATAAGGSTELGTDNQDVIITPTEWESFAAGLQQMAGKLRQGEIQPLRLHNWTESRYGFEVVSKPWLDCLANPRDFFELSV